MHVFHDVQHLDIIGSFTFPSVLCSAAAALLRQDPVDHFRCLHFVPAKAQGHRRCTVKSWQLSGSEKNERSLFQWMWGWNAACWGQDIWRSQEFPILMCNLMYRQLRSPARKDGWQLPRAQELICRCCNCFRRILCIFGLGSTQMETGFSWAFSSAVCEQVVTEVPSEKVCSNECPATGSWEEAGGRPREETDGNEGRYPHPLLQFTRDFLL